MDKNSNIGLTDLCLDYLDLGISVMSADFYLVYTNKKFLEIVDLPQELMVIGKTHLSDVFRYNAKRGEYGDGDIEEQVSLRMELASKCEPHSFERTRPDGAVIKVDGNPLPDGGFITTYTDVSELHASRIALEKVNNKLDERVRSRTKELASRTAELSEKATTLETVMQNVDTGITLLDKDLKLTLWNDRYFELLNCPEELLFVGATVETILKEINQGPDSGEEFSDDEFETIIKASKILSLIRASENRKTDNSSKSDANRRRQDSWSLWQTYLIRKMPKLFYVKIMKYWKNGLKREPENSARPKSSRKKPAARNHNFWQI